MTNKLLLEAGFGTYWSQWGGVNHPGSNFTRARRRDRAVHEGGLRGLRRHSRPAVPVGHLPPQPAGHRDVARVGFLRHGRAEHEVRLSGRLSLRQPVHLYQRPVRVLPLQQRRAEPDHRKHQRLSSQPARALRRVLRAGPENVRPRHAARRCSLRSRLELLPRSDGRTRAIPASGGYVPRDRRRDRLQRRHTARRRRLGRVRNGQDIAQGQRRASICRPRRTAWRTARSGRAAGSRGRRRASGPTTTRTSCRTATS